MIISGGVNIYPQEAENVLAGHPQRGRRGGHRRARPRDGRGGEGGDRAGRPVERGPEVEAELIAACRERLAAYKCPRSVDFVTDLPRDPNGKLYKRLLKERYWEGHDTRVV
jgi:long-chain acyl-CoA synthetase